MHQFLKFIFGIELYMFGQFLCPSSGVQHCTHSNRYMSCYADCLLYDIYLLLCVQCQITDDGRRNCPKHVEFYYKNKFEKLVHLVGFIMRMYHDARSSECHIHMYTIKILKVSILKMTRGFLFHLSIRHRRKLYTLFQPLRFQNSFSLPKNKDKKWKEVKLGREENKKKSPDIL